MTLTDEEKVKEALDWQDKDIGSEQKSRIENHFKLINHKIKIMIFFYV